MINNNEKFRRNLDRASLISMLFLSLLLSACSNPNSFLKVTPTPCPPFKPSTPLEKVFGSEGIFEKKNILPSFSDCSGQAIPHEKATAATYPLPIATPTQQ